MIRFACHCGHPFELPDDQAGALTQCPKCGRLNDVPLLSDLRNIEEDGTYRLDEEPQPTLEDRMAEVRRVYHPGRVDDDGVEIDLRSPTPPAVDGNGEPIPLEYEVAVPPTKVSPPKYDPVTGELIRPVEIKAPAPRARSAMPIAKRPKKRYAIELLPKIQTFALFAMLFRPINMVVMLIVYVVLLFQAFFLVLPLVGVIAFLFTTIGVLGHFVVVIDETGPACKDELPRPLRDFSFFDDMLMPFVNLVVSYAVSYGLAFFVVTRNIPGPLLYPLFWSLIAIGAMVTPVILLTTSTSGNYVNLRPDRLIGVIRVLGIHYAWMVASLFVAQTCFFYGFVWTQYAIARIFSFSTTPPPFLGNWFVALPLLALGVYLAHYTGWLFGQAYRVYQPKFPWAFQGRRADGAMMAEGSQVLPDRGFDVLHPKQAKMTPSE